VNSKILIVIGTIIIIIAISGVYYAQLNNEEIIKRKAVQDVSDSDIQKKIEPNIPASLFRMIVSEDDYIINNGIKIWSNAEFELKPEFADLYDDIGITNNPQNTIVILPTFTAMAYSENGFYSYYKQECDTNCLTVEIDSYQLGYHGSDNAVKVLKLLGYSFVTDVDVDKNPNILSKYDKIILLHNEYVTRNEFDAITNHHKVIYLYPNALYAEIKTNYDKNTITLVRGHNYPIPEIKNGFDWKFDNTVFEYDIECKDMYFYNIANGFMLNCYPEHMIYKNKVLLKAIKEF